MQYRNGGKEILEEQKRERNLEGDRKFNLLVSQISIISSAVRFRFKYFSAIFLLFLIGLHLARNLKINAFDHEQLFY